MALSARKTKPAPADFSAIAHELGRSFAARAAEADETDAFVAGNYPALKSSGLIDAAVPEALGGGGAGMSELADMLRVMAHYCSSTALALAMHTHQVAVPAWRWQHQKIAAVEPLLKRVAAEKIILCTSGGSDWIAGSGRAEKVDGGYKITARKVFSSGAPVGDVMTTGAILETEEGPTVLHFGLPMKSPHVRIDPVWKSLGMRGTGSHDVVIEGHVVPEAAVMARRPAGQWHPLFQVITVIAIPLIFSVYLGVAESAREIAVGLARKRRSDRNITQLTGRMETSLRAARLGHAAMIDTSNRNAPSAEAVNDVMMGQRIFTENALRAVELAMEVAGGQGFYRAQGLERRFRDMQGARFHPMQQCQQAEYAGAMALGLPVERIF
jgi:indole-3-acetate monooxygenase